jgi:rubrerythrin
LAGLTETITGSLGVLWKMLHHQNTHGGKVAPEFFLRPNLRNYKTKHPEKQTRPSGPVTSPNRLKSLFEGIAAIEKSHQERYQKLLQTVESGAVFDKASQVLWECRNCGHHVENPAAPGACAVCKHPKAFFEITKNNY